MVMGKGARSAEYWRLCDEYPSCCSTLYNESYFHVRHEDMDSSSLEHVIAA